MRVQYWAVGLFITIGFCLLTGLLFLIGDRQEAFNKHLELKTEFSNLNGLASGAKVRVAGFDAGKIKKIDIPKSASAKFRLEIQVEEKLHGMIRKDSVVSIETDGVVGDKFVLVKRNRSVGRGSSRRYAAQQGTSRLGSSDGKRFRAAE